MLKMLLVLIFVSTSLDAFAKTKKVTDFKAPLAFRSEYYYQMNLANRKKYLKILMDLRVKIEKSEKGSKKSHASYILEDLLFPQADAVTRQCLFGGIVMVLDSCPKTLASGVPAAYADVEHFSCGANENRCTLAAGLKADGKGYCYDRSVEMATAKCQELAAADKDAAGFGGVERLANKLNNCSSGGADCSSLLAAVSRDSGGINEFCNTRSNKAYCQAATKQVTAISSFLPPTSGPTPMDGQAEGCDKAEQDMIAGGLGADTKASPMWLKLVGMSRGCPGASQLLDAQLKKFGACEDLNAPQGQNMETAISENSDLRDSITKMSMGNLTNLTPEEKAAFGKFFGIAPNEYRDLFCSSSDSTDFYNRLGGVTTPVETAQTKADANKAIFNAFITQDNLANAASAVPTNSFNEQFKTLLSKYAESHDQVANLNAQYDAFNDSCANGAGNNNSCRMRDTVFSTDAAKAQKASERTNRVALQKEFERLMGVADPKFILGANNYNAAVAVVEKGSSNSPAQRRKFLACANKAVKVARVQKPGSRLAEEVGQSNVDPKCHLEYITKFDGSRDYGKLFIRDNSRNKCYTSDGVFLPNQGQCPNRSAIQLTNPSNGQNADKVCVDNATFNDKYSPYYYNCSSAPATFDPSDNVH